LNSVEVRLYREGDEKQIVRLFRTVYGQDLTVEQWRWKYLGQGNVRAYAAVGVAPDGEIVAHFGALPIRMRFRDRSIQAFQLVDAMVKAEWRAKTLGLPPNQSIFYRLGCLLYETYTTFFYAFPGVVYRSWGLKAGHIEDALVVVEYRCRCGDVRRNAGRGYALKPLNPLDPRIDSLWLDVRESLRWSAARDREFLRWRFAANPFRAHRFYALVHPFRRGLLGWVVLRDDGRDVRVMDLLFRDGMLPALLARTARVAGRNGAEHLRLWLPDRYRATLLAAGFAAVDIQTWMPAFRHVRVADPDEIRPNLYYTMGDTDFL
jgi:hypothetical protein